MTTKPKARIRRGIMTNRGLIDGPFGDPYGFYDPRDDGGRGTSYREMERFHAHEMSYVETDRVTKQEPFVGRPDPHSVLVQEARGTREMVTSDQLPKQMDQEALKKMGVEILGPSKGDDLFIDVKLPQGWKKVPCREDSRTTYLVDSDGNKRAYMWYKGASYDRAAYGGIRSRFDIVTRNYNDYTVGVAWVVDAKEPGTQRPIFQTADRKYADTREGLKEESQQALRTECVVWLDAHYPDWRDRTAYWNSEPSPTEGTIPPFNQRKTLTPDRPYEANHIRQQVEAARERLFAPYAVGRPANWSTDKRTKDLICLAAWLREELTRLGIDDLGRITQEGVFYRSSRSEEDLYGLVARIMNDTAAGNIDRNRIPHRRWG